MSWTQLAQARDRTLIALVVVTMAATIARADALVVTRAMQASTIAEIFIEDEQIRVEFEIGARDLTAFANVLPDEIYEKVAGDARPRDDRIREFVSSDWVITGDDSPVRGTIERMVFSKRVVRDEVTGEPLIEQPADAEHVIRLTLHYELPGHPQSLRIRPPMTDELAAANIGFVCYHRGLPVNDFRYLPGEVALDLDWADPWYSRFRNRNLRRQFDAPLSAYLYVEPYEVRKEIIVRPRDLETWLDLDLQDDGVIPVSQQEELKKRIAEFLSERNPVTIDGRTAKGQIDRIHFIRRTLRATGIIEPPEELDATSATLGVIFVYPIDRLPDEVSMRWELFSPKLQAIPAVASDEAGGFPSQVTPDAPVLNWLNYLTNPTSPHLRIVARPPSKPRILLPLLSMGIGGIALGTLAVVARRKRAGGRAAKVVSAWSVAAVVICVILVTVVGISISGRSASTFSLSEPAARDVVTGLLHNVYRAFDHHDESIIYDRLAKSISGELLSDVYLETRKSMAVKNQGGLRISVKDVEVTKLEPVETAAVAASFRCRWHVSGWIGHWGHTHRRANVHEALLTIAVREGVWKITAIEMLDERTLEPSRVSASRRRGARE